MSLAARYISDGRYIDYTPAQDVAAGDVIVQGELPGVAVVDIPANTLGALCVDGLVDFAKATGGGTAIAAGTVLYWDATAKRATTSAGGGANKYIGKSALAAADGESVVRVRFNPL
jgi:predicted RecA/RadA family phage recombinase